MTRHLLTLLFALTTVVTLVPAANAQVCAGLGFGYGYDFGALYNSLQQRVPYFAAHPPVYYSYPVPRPYGYSPFAYPPFVQTPDILGVVEPVMIENPFVPSSQTKDEESQDRLTHQSQVQPLVIHNPYFTNEPQLARSER